MRIIKILLFVVSVFSITYSGRIPDYIGFINPGLTIGYDFGKKTGFTLGGQIGINTLGIGTGFWWSGINVGLEKNIKQNQWKFRQEFVAGYFIGGVGFGGEYYCGRYNMFTRLIAFGYFGQISYIYPLQGLYSGVSVNGQFPIVFMSVN